MKPGHWSSPSGRHGAFAPIWAVLLAILFYGAQLGPEVLDGLVHLEHRATRHPTSAHFEDPGQQSHSDRCLISQARGESRACPAPVAEPPSSALAIGEPVALDGQRSTSSLCHSPQARAPPVPAV